MAEPSTVKLPEPAIRVTSKLGTHIGGKSTELRKGDALSHQAHQKEGA